VKIANNKNGVLHVAREAWFLQQNKKVDFNNQMQTYFSCPNYDGSNETLVIVMEDLRGKVTRIDQFHGGQDGASIENQFNSGDGA
jgi:hypothetical protein